MVVAATRGAVDSCRRSGGAVERDGGGAKRCVSDAPLVGKVDRLPIEVDAETDRRLFGPLVACR